jgi:Zn-dependent hydrolases, including glyoxylases
MVEEVLTNIFRIEVPLPQNPLRALNSYLIKGRGRSLLIDTGFNWAECKEAQIKALQHLGVNWSQVDFFLTHVHGDHSGLLNELASENSVVYCSEKDWNILNESMTEQYWENMNAFYVSNGFPLDAIRDYSLNIDYFISGTDLKYRFVQDGERLAAGGYQFNCISTPGHSPGHLCLYEPEQRILFSGDHILAGITSNITCWNDGQDDLGMYLASLDKIDQLDIRLVLPGHREVISDCRRRIAELKQHHEDRLQEIITLLQRGAMTAYEAASHMHWDIAFDTWEKLPGFQRWFATGEALAHLNHLYCKGEAAVRNSSSKIEYSLAKGS